MRNLDLVKYVIDKVVEKYDLKGDKACPEARAWKLGNCGLSIYMAESLPEQEVFWYNEAKNIVATTIMSGVGDKDEGILVEEKVPFWDEEDNEWYYHSKTIEYFKFCEFEKEYGEKYLY